MIRFVDLTPYYWTTAQKFPICAFIDTKTGNFLMNANDDEHTFPDMEAIDAHQQSDMLRRLLPPGFFNQEYGK